MYIYLKFNGKGSHRYGYFTEITFHTYLPCMMNKLIHSHICKIISLKFELVLAILYNSLNNNSICVELKICKNKLLS